MVSLVQYHQFMYLLAKGAQIGDFNKTKSALKEFASMLDVKFFVASNISSLLNLSLSEDDFQMKETQLTMLYHSL